ncbi:hypothetical protein J4234_00255 [Candidatus Woesearchaeota archaeon]|nr:hypothetical protein [Candidatus Woesearchaeota archaeon]
MAHAIATIEFGFDVIILILSLVVFLVFLFNINKFVAGESKKIFALLLAFLLVHFLSLAAVELLEIAHATGFYKEPLTEELEDTAELVEHILQLIGLGILFYMAVSFANFAKKLEKAKS